MKRKIKGTSARKSSRYPVGSEKTYHLPNKVAESQAAYGLITKVPKVEASKILKSYSSRLTKTQQQLLSASKKNVGVEMPEGVRQFAQKNALFPHLETALRLVHECFPTVKNIQLAYEFDWEVENENWIAINIQISGKPDQVLEQYLLFNRQMTQQIPPGKSNKILLGIDGLGPLSRRAKIST